MEGKNKDGVIVRESVMGKENEHDIYKMLFDDIATHSITDNILAIEFSLFIEDIPLNYINTRNEIMEMLNADDDPLFNGKMGDGSDYDEPDGINSMDDNNRYGGF